MRGRHALRSAPRGGAQQKPRPQAPQLSAKVRHARLAHQPQPPPAAPAAQQPSDSSIRPCDKFCLKGQEANGQQVVLQILSPARTDASSSVMPVIAAGADRARG